MVLALLMIAPAQAALFSDVPADFPFAPHIEALAQRTIVRGNPDRTFRPASAVNRAEMLTLLYRATERSPVDTETGCFKDVERGSWYETVVCDAALQGYVSGYPDKTFRPEQSVNRMEALKMLHTVLGFDHPTDIPPAIGARYADIDLSAWYAPYVASAFLRRVIPIAGQEGPHFEPGLPLTRGEAAAYIAHALQVPLPDGQTDESSAASEGTSTSSVTGQSSSGPSTGTAELSFPFRDAGTFIGRTARIIRFTLRRPVVTELRATVEPGRGKPGLTCRLFRMGGSTDFSSEYYRGYVAGNVCVIRASLDASDYQLEIRPNEENASFEITGTTVSGDGNDGFREARAIGVGASQSGVIEAEDIADWYAFTLNRPQTLTVKMAEESDVSCIVYAMEDVDLFGFVEPRCDSAYDYPRGRYVIGVQRKDGRDGVRTYGIGLR